jgi:hypothetical protein
VDCAHGPHVDDVDDIETQVTEIVMHAALDIFGLDRREPRTVFATDGAHLGDDHQIVRIRVKRLANQLVGNVGTVEVAGVDVIDAGGHRFAKHREGCITVLWRPEYAGAG